MKKQLLMALGLVVAIGQAQAREVEIEVYGMTCAFCVDSLQRKLTKMDGIKSVNVSLKEKRVLLQTAADSPSLDSIRQTVVDAGFTPEKITVKDQKSQ